MHFKKFKKGFTLIELLIVIAIIGVLSSVALASLNSARSKSKEAAIKANLRNIISSMEISHTDVGNYSLGCASIQSVLDVLNSSETTASCFTVGFFNHGNWGVSVRSNTDLDKVWMADSSGVGTLDIVDIAESNWVDANSVCANGGGRLPSFEQLKSWSDTYDEVNYPIDFNPSIAYKNYWTNTNYPLNDTQAMYVTMGAGHGFSSKSSVLPVRCVK